MKYIPGSIAIKPNQVSVRLIPQLNPKKTFILENIRPVKIIENEKEVKKLKYIFVEAQAQNDYRIRDESLVERVEVIFDDYKIADATINKILGIREDNQQDINEYDPNPDAVDRAEIRRALNDVATKQFSRRPVR